LPPSPVEKVCSGIKKWIRYSGKGPRKRCSTSQLKHDTHNAEWAEKIRTRVLIWDEAEELEVQVMEMSRIKLGADHPSTLTSMANLAATYWNQGRWDEAEELEVQVMETRKTKLGADHPSTLSSMANLASTYRNQEVQRP
jgi:hypothetical protein